jgi:hypothetical protein
MNLSVADSAALIKIASLKNFVKIFPLLKSAVVQSSRFCIGSSSPVQIAPVTAGIGIT